MKIGTLLTAAIVSLSAVGGGLAVYVAASKYQTMDKVSVAQSRLEVVRAVGDIPRYMNSERGFATNILYGPPAIDPNIRAELNNKVRKLTDTAREKMNAVRKNLSSSLDDATAIGAGIDDLNVNFNALRPATTVCPSTASPALNMACRVASLSAPRSRKTTQVVSGSCNSSNAGSRASSAATSRASAMQRSIISPSLRAPMARRHTQTLSASKRRVVRTDFVTRSGMPSSTCASELR